MKGDFSRDTFDASQHFIRVLMQQGRVQLDADWNEQVAILLRYLQKLAANLLGPFAGPKDILKPDSDLVLQQNCGFEIIVDPARLNRFLELTTNERTRLQDLLKRERPPILLGKGHYYVDGILCENDDYVPYSAQPDLTNANALSEGFYLIYLDVWERHITYVEAPDIREIALGGPDTSTRSKIVWQVKAINKTPPSSPAFQNLSCDRIKQDWRDWQELFQPKNRGLLKAQTQDASKKATDPCTISPEARFRGLENQLYRVEVHAGGKAGQQATFKWSRDNGSVVFPIVELKGNAVVLEHLGLDDRHALRRGDWVEIMDDDVVNQGGPGPFLQIEEIDAVESTVTLTVPEGSKLPIYENDDSRHPLLRRWDSGLIDIVEGTSESEWLDLEDGIRIQFQPQPAGETFHAYRTGDYWLISARTAIGDILWPMARDSAGNKYPLALPPHGVAHHFGPLWIIEIKDGGTIVADPTKDCRCKFAQPCANVTRMGLAQALIEAPESSAAPAISATPKRARTKSNGSRR